MSVDFSKHPIYFFDDKRSNHKPRLADEFTASTNIPIQFVKISEGEEPIAGANKRVAEAFQGAQKVDVPPVLEGERAGKFFRHSGFTPLATPIPLLGNSFVVGESVPRMQFYTPFPYADTASAGSPGGGVAGGGGGGGGGAAAFPADVGVPFALVFDWDQTMTLRNGGFEALDPDDAGGAGSLKVQTTNAKWDVGTLIKWYLHDPDDPDRIKMLSSFFRDAQAAEVPIFILTSNRYIVKHRELIRDILKYGLGVDIPIKRILYSREKTKKICGEIYDSIAPSRMKKLHRLWIEMVASSTHGAFGATGVHFFSDGRASPPRPPAAAAAQVLTPAQRSKPMNIVDGGGGGVQRDAASDFGGGRRKTRRRKRKKRKRRRRRTRRRHRNDFDKELKRVIAQHRRYQIARGDKRFKATRRLVKWSRPNKTKRKNRVYYRKRKSRKKR